MSRPNASDLSYVIPVDFLPPSALPLPGRLGLTRAPGRWAPDRSTDSHAWLREDLDALAGIHDAKVLVTLLQPHEIAELGDLKGAARRAGLAWLSFPIPDMGIPSDLTASRRVVDEILYELEGGHAVVPCRGGAALTGVSACCPWTPRFRSTPSPPERRRARPGSIAPTATSDRRGRAAAPPSRRRALRR